MEVERTSIQEAKRREAVMRAKGKNLDGNVEDDPVANLRMGYIGGSNFRN